MPGGCAGKEREWFIHSFGSGMGRIARAVDQAARSCEDVRVMRMAMRSRRTKSLCRQHVLDAVGLSQNDDPPFADGHAATAVKFQVIADFDVGGN